MQVTIHTIFACKEPLKAQHKNHKTTEKKINKAKGYI